ncbi:MAG TPA: isoprenylcysteine carboxylmethyltransferase family protein [Acidobacteriota bacterium]
MIQHDRSGEHPRGDLGQLVLLVLFLALWALDSFVFGFSTALAGAVPLFVRLPLAAVLVVVAGTLAQKAHVVFHIPAGGPRLMTGGVFRFVRHPMYLGALLSYVAFVLATLSLLSLAFLAVVFLFYNFIASFEERSLAARCGREYLDYKASVPKWLPRLRPRPRS